MARRLGCDGDVIDRDVLGVGRKIKIAGQFKSNGCRGRLITGQADGLGTCSRSARISRQRREICTIGRGLDNHAVPGLQTGAAGAFRIIERQGDDIVRRVGGKIGGALNCPSRRIVFRHKVTQAKRPGYNPHIARGRRTRGSVRIRLGPVCGPQSRSTASRRVGAGRPRICAGG